MGEGSWYDPDIERVVVTEEQLRDKIADLAKQVAADYTGENPVLLVGVLKGAFMFMADFARAHGIDLEESVAYADSASDLPMLEASGHPVAVNPETKLAAIARKRGWHTEDWHKDGGAPTTLLPFGRRQVLGLPLSRRKAGV